MTFVTFLLVGTVVYAASNVQGWVGDNKPEAVGNPICSAAVGKRALAPRDVTLNVYNTTSHNGLAATVASSLERQGFLIATIDNDPLGKTIPSLGEIRHGPSGSAGAVIAAAWLPGAVMVKDDRMDASVDLVLGNKFRTLRAPHHSKAPKAAKGAGC